MQDLQLIKSAFEKIDDLLNDEIAKSFREGDTIQKVKWEERREILNRAFYVLCFGQFEREVDDKFEAAKASRQSNNDWTKRRGWDTEYIKGKRVRFEDRVAMVLDRNTGSDYGDVMRHYGDRNHAAHGGLSKPIGSVDNLILDLLRLGGRLTS